MLRQQAMSTAVVKSTPKTMKMIILAFIFGGSWWKKISSVRQLRLLATRASIGFSFRSTQQLLASAAIGGLLFKQGRRAFDQRSRALGVVGGKCQALLRRQCEQPQRHRANYLLPDEVPSPVLDWLFIGGKAAASNRKMSQQFGIRHVLNCSAGLPFASSETRNKRLHLQDVRSQRLLPQLVQAFDFLEEARQNGGRCLEHCRQGASRSVSVVLAYLVTHCGFCLKEAWQLVRKSRPAAQPNRGFCEQLIDLECAVHGTASMKISDLHFGSRSNYDIQLADLKQNA
jgi:hypothetical protein